MNTATAVARVAKTAARPALWFCACNLLTAALSAQCTSVSQVPNGTISSGTPCYSNNDTLTAAGVTINGSAKVTFVAGKTIRLTPGFRATAPTGGAASTTFHAWVESAPSVVSVSPATGSAMTQTFKFTASSPSGFADITELQLLFNTTQTGADGCYIRYRANALYLADNSGTNWLGGFAPGSAGTASNSYCSISGSGASVTGSGTQLSVTVPVTFQSVFAGAKNTYAITYDDDAMNSGWQPMGTWTVPGTPVGPDFSIQTAQAWFYMVGGTPTTATYTLTITPLNGFTGPVSFNATPFYGCSNPVFSPAQVAGPAWTTTLSMVCNSWLTNAYWTTVTAYGGGKSHDLYLYLQVNPAPSFLLTTVVNPPGAGTIMLNPPGGWYSAGSLVTVTATPAAGYQLQSISGLDSNSGSGGSVMMTGNRTVTANFGGSASFAIGGTVTQNAVGLSGVTITLSGGSSGQITTGSGGGYSFTVPSGNYTLTPSLQGFVFSPVSWSGSVAGTISGINFIATPTEVNEGAASPGNATILPPNGGVPLALGRTPSSNDPIFGPQEDVVIDASSPASYALPGASVNNGSLVFTVSSVDIKHNVTARGFNYVVFHSAGAISISGPLTADGSGVAFVSSDPIEVKESVNASGKSGFNGGAGQLAGLNGATANNGGVGGNGGDGGTGNAGMGGAGAGGGLGWGLSTCGPRDCTGGAGNGNNGSGDTHSPGTPVWNAGQYARCSQSGGGTGGSNGTKGADAAGFWPNGRFTAALPFGSAVVGTSPQASGGGAGASGGCGPWGYYPGTQTLRQVASGGGGGGGGGGDGAVFFITTNDVTVYPGVSIRANGGSGGSGGAGTRNADLLYVGGNGGGGGGGGAGGYIVLQGRTVNVTGAQLSASGGQGGAAGAAGYGAQNGATGGGGGGGRIAITAATAPQGITASSGSNATGQQGGSPTISITVQAPQPTISAFLPNQVQAGIDRYMLTVQGTNLLGSGGIPTFDFGNSGITYTIDAHDAFQITGWLNATNAVPGDYTVTLRPAGSSQTATAVVKVTAGAGSITAQYPRTAQGQGPISDSIGIWWLGTAAIDSNDGCQPDGAEPNCYWTWARLTVVPGLGGMPPTAESPATWSFTDTGTQQSSPLVTYECSAPDGSCSQVTVRATSAGWGIVAVQATLAGTKAAVLTIGVDYPALAEVFRVEDIIWPNITYPAYQSHNYMRLISGSGRTIPFMPIHEEFPLGNWQSCGGSTGWTAPIPRTDPNPSYGWGSWLTNSNGEFSDGSGQLAADTVGYGCIQGACSPVSDIPGTMKNPPQPLSSRANAWSVHYYYAGSQDVTGSGKYVALRPDKQVRYTDHGRNEPQEWSCQAP